MLFIYFTVEEKIGGVQKLFFLGEGSLPFFLIKKRGIY